MLKKIAILSLLGIVLTGELYCAIGIAYWSSDFFEPGSYKSSHQDPRIHGRVKSKEDLQKTRQTLLHELRICQESKDVKCEARISNDLGFLFWNQKDHFNALTYFQKALDCHQQSLNDESRMRTLILIGDLHRKLDSFTDAEKAYQESLRQAEKSGGVDDKLIALVSLAEVNWDLKLYAKARKYYEKAVAIAGTLEDRTAEVQILLDYALMYDHGCDAECWALCSQSLEKAGSIGNSKAEARALAILGAMLYGQRQLLKAEELLKQSCDIARNIGDPHIEAFTQYYLGEALSVQHGKQPEAIEHYQRALEITEQLGIVEAKSDLLMHLTNLCEALGKSRLELGYCERLQSIAKKYGGEYPTMVAPRCFERVNQLRLIRASRNNDQEEVKTLIDGGVDPNCRDTDTPDTPLYAASSKGHLGVLRLLLTKGAKVKRLGWAPGVYPLYAAAENGHLEVVKLLLEKGAPDDEQNSLGFTALMLAAKAGHKDIVEVLLNKGSDINAPHTNMGTGTALSQAVENGHLDTVKLLMDRGAGLDAKRGDGSTLVMVAAQANNRDLICLFLNKGINVNSVGKNGSTALKMAVKQGNPDVVRMLLDAGADPNAASAEYPTALATAAGEGNADLVRVLLAAGAGVNAAPVNGPTALIAAVENGNLDIIHTLLNAGADVNLLSRNHSSPLKNAVDNRQSEVVQLLMDKGANVNSKAKDGTSILMSAVMHCGIDMVKLLLENGAEVNVTNQNGSSPLVLAAIAGKTDIVNLLMERGAKMTLPVAAILGDIVQVRKCLKAGDDINARHNREWTALMEAARNGHLEIVKLLLKKGADTRPVRKDEGCAFFDAISSNRVDVVKLFLEQGVDVNMKRSSGLTPLMVAARSAGPEMASLLLYRGADAGAGYGPDYMVRIKALHMAAWSGRADMVKLLLKINKDADLRCGDYTEVIQGAAGAGHQQVVQLLLEAGANVNVSFSYAPPPLMWAARNGYPEMVKFLLKHGADVNATHGENNETALKIALRHGQDEVVKVLEAQGAKDTK